MRCAVVLALFLGGIAGACAPAGMHYGTWAEGPVAAFTLKSNDTCQRAEMRSAGAVSWLNSKVGKRDGPARRVIAIEDLRGETGSGGSSISCQGALVMEGGLREIGTVSFHDPGDGAAMNVSWESDVAKATRQDSPEKRAIQKYCAAATPIACSLYVRKVSACPSLGSAAYSMLLYQRQMQTTGATRDQAAELSVDAMRNGNLPISAKDLVAIAERAKHLSGGILPQEFRAEIISECLTSALGHSGN